MGKDSTQQAQQQAGDKLRPLPVLGTREPWLMVGCSRTTWHRLVSAGHAPQPIRLPHGSPFWRVRDIEDWLASLRPDQGRWRALARRKADAS